MLYDGNLLSRLQVGKTFKQFLPFLPIFPAFDIIRICSALSSFVILVRSFAIAELKRYIHSLDYDATTLFFNSNYIWNKPNSYSNVVSSGITQVFDQYLVSETYATVGAMNWNKTISRMCYCTLKHDSCQESTIASAVGLWILIFCSFKKMV